MKISLRIVSFIMLLVMVVTSVPATTVNAIDTSELTGAQVSDELKKINLLDKLSWASSTGDIGFTAQAAFDGNDTTRWCAANGTFPQTLTVDLGEVKDIAQVNIKFELVTTWEYTLRVSEDGVNWTDYGTNPADIPSQQDYSNVNAAQARYVAVEVTNSGLNEGGSPYWASIFEMSVLDSAGNNMALNMPCAATTVSGHGAGVSAAFDGDYWTRYCAANGTLPQQLMVDLGGNYEVGAIYLCFEQTSSWSYTLETSLNGVTWFTYAQKSAQELIEATETKDIEARYVRLTVSGSADGAWASIWEMEIYARMQKMDLSDKLTWSSSTSSVGYSAHAAFDGDEATRWCAANDTYPQTLTVDLGEVKDIAQVNIKFELPTTWEYTLRVSKDGVNWTDYGTNPADIPSQQDYSNVKAAQARYVAVEITNSGANSSGSGLYWASIFEMSVLDSAGSNMALNKPCMATSSSDYGFSTKAAFDGNNDTRYCASGNVFPQQLMVDLGEIYNVGAVRLYFELASDWNYVLETSQDGVSWNTYVKPGVQNLQDVTHSNAAKARYVRLTVNGSSNGAWASLWEMDVYTIDKEMQDENGAKIEFCGGSLRMDSTAYTETSLRFGYKIYLPEGATLNSWSWEYTTVDPNIVLNGNGKNMTVNGDGSINANLVITGIPKGYYDLVLSAKMKIEYTLSNGAVCTLEETVVRGRSVNLVAESILASQKSTQEEKDYAANILQ